MLIVAIEWEIYRRTHSATALGLVGLMIAAPVVLLSLPAGHIADRYNRKYIILCTQALARAKRRRPRGSTGLFHLAILYPTRDALADALRRLLAAEIPLDGASDHGVSEALYLRDPDENGVELYWDRPRELWPRTKRGGLAMFTRPLDLESLLRTAG